MRSIIFPLFAATALALTFGPSCKKIPNEKNKPLIDMDSLQAQKIKAANSREINLNFRRNKADKLDTLNTSILTASESPLFHSYMDEMRYFDALNLTPINAEIVINASGDTAYIVPYGTPYEQIPGFTGPAIN